MDKKNIADHKAEYCIGYFFNKVETQYAILKHDSAEEAKYNDYVLWK